MPRQDQLTTHERRMEGEGSIPAFYRPRPASHNLLVSRARLAVGPGDM